MRETRHDLTEILTDSVTDAQLKKALMEMRPVPVPESKRGERNISVALYAPGALVTLPDGTEYRIGAKGNWERLTPKPPKQKRRRR